MNFMQLHLRDAATALLPAMVPPAPALRREWHMPCSTGRRHRSLPMDTRFDPARYVEEAAPLMGITLDPAHKPGIVENMARLAAMADLVMGFPLPEETELGPVFRP
jgi:hypothetical protein